MYNSIYICIPIGRVYQEALSNCKESYLGHWARSPSPSACGCPHAARVGWKRWWDKILKFQWNHPHPPSAHDSASFSQGWWHGLMLGCLRLLGVAKTQKKLRICRKWTDLDGHGWTWMFSWKILEMTGYGFHMIPQISCWTNLFSHAFSRIGWHPRHAAMIKKRRSVAPACYQVNRNTHITCRNSL